MTQSDTIGISARSKGTINEDGTVDMVNIESFNIVIKDGDNSKSVYDTLKQWTDLVYGTPLDTHDDFGFTLEDMINESNRVEREEKIDKLLNENDEDIQPEDEPE